ncbi:MAG: PACE efflux transporter [Leucobacter sp.]
MSPHIRRLIYVVTYELIAVLLVTVALAYLGFSSGGSVLVAVVSSTIALIWNYAWTTAFEAWERRQASQKRTIPRRIAHTMGFEAGLIILLVPVMAWILQITLLEAFILDLGLLAFFLIYTFVFAWLFDLVLPRRVQGNQVEST